MKWAGQSKKRLALRSQKVSLGAYPPFKISIDRFQANERCAILLEVDPENQARRLQLKKEKAKFEKVRDRLVGLTRYPSDEMPSNGPL